MSGVIESIPEPGVPEWVTELQREQIRAAVESFWCLQIALLIKEPEMARMSNANVVGYLYLANKVSK